MPDGNSMSRKSAAVGKSRCNEGGSGNRLKGVVRILERCNVICDILSGKQMEESIFRLRATDEEGGQGRRREERVLRRRVVLYPLLLKRILCRIARALRFARENSGTCVCLDAK